MTNKPVEFYEDNRGEWRWRVRALENNEIIACASEGFATKQKAQENYAIGQE